MVGRANERIVPHTIWVVQHGCQRLVVGANDTDTVTRLLRCTDGRDCRVLMKAHVVTGNDVTSKSGTKFAAMQCNPIVYLTQFAERNVLPETDIAKMEEYLVRVWAVARAKPQAKTFDQLLLYVHTSVSAPTAINKIPPASSVVHRHITGKR